MNPFEALHAATLSVIAKPLLDEARTADQVVGIPIVDLPIPPVEFADMTYRHHAARVAPGKWVGMHYHEKGLEPYVILSGDAEMNTGEPLVDDPTYATWTGRRALERGSSFVVPERMVHCLRNVGDTPLDFVFACPDAHLCADDRVMVDNLPPHFPKP